MSDNGSLMMAFDDKEDPLGLLYTDDTGLYVRAEGQWFVITADNQEFEGAEVVDVDRDFLDFFDKLDAKGSEPTYKQTQKYASPVDAPEEGAPE
jgi:hypothetical protein